VSAVEVGLPPLVQVSRHPLLEHKMAELRDHTTPPPRFRQLVRELTHLLLYEACQDIRLQPATVQTPLASCSCRQIGESIGIMPILRAGLGMAEAVLEMIPAAQVWHLGLYRDHETCKPVTYYNKIPPGAAVDLSLVVDPMLATGGSAVAAIDILKKLGARRIKYLGLIAAPEGVQALTSEHPDVQVYLAALDSHLNEKAYIVPGLGDAGDRQFATG
jgi:uracil phosphoribosyltransferase